jgi:C1A family cysteine protease
MPVKRALGWVPDLPDHRDFIYAAPRAVLQQLPPSVDLTSNCPTVYDQGQLGSCTGNAIGGGIEFEILKQQLPDFMPCRLFIYYNERDMEGTINSDSGAQIRDGIKSVANLGVCPESEWLYDITKFTQKPPDNCYADALNNTVTSYHRVARDLNQMKGCLADGYPFVIGFTVYNSFQPAVEGDGHVPMPTQAETVDGGHAVLIVGYDDASQWFIVRNSWGVIGQMNGYFTMPYAYLLDSNLSDDFWTIRVVK